MFSILKLIFLTLLFILSSSIIYSEEVITQDNRFMPTPFSDVFSSQDYPGPVLGTSYQEIIQPITQDLWQRYPELKKLNLKISGWIEPSYNISSSNNSNIPLAFNIVPNQLVLDQFVMHVERAPNTLQTEKIDYGFRVSNILGIDYRYTVSQGIFSGQLSQNNNLYGDDPVEFSGQIYVPNIAQGMLITIGRYFSPSDIESTFAPFSDFLTHSLSITYDIYTMTGINSILQLNKQTSLLFGLHSGSDMAPWAAGAHPSFQFLTRWVANDNNNSILGGISSLNNGKFKGDHDNLQQFSLTWTHRFNQNVKHSAEIVYLYQFDAPLGGNCNFGPIKSFGGGGGCGPIIPGLSNALGIVNISSVKFLESNTLSFRLDLFNDPQGQRTGYATPYIDASLGITHWCNSYIKIRPEIRHEKAFKAKPYNNGTKSEQTTFNIDTIVLI